MPKTTEEPWPFLDPPNTVVFTRVRILDEGDWVHYVTHDEDGAWQFHPSSGPATVKEAAVVSLRGMLEREPRIGELADLSLGWQAWRETKDGPWNRAPKEPG